LEDYLALPRGRQPYHNPNWGGARPGSGRPQLILPETVVDVAPKPEFAKPLDYLWSRMNDPALPAQYRDQLAVKLLPFFHPRLGMTVAFSRRLVEQISRATDEEIDQQLAALGYVKIATTPTVQ
jgi:hypothetical protein